MNQACVGIIIGTICFVWTSVSYASDASTDATLTTTKSAAREFGSLDKPLLLAEEVELRKVPKPKPAPKPKPEPKPVPKPEPKPKPVPNIPRCPDFDGDGRPDC